MVDLVVTEDASFLLNSARVRRSYQADRTFQRLTLAHPVSCELVSSSKAEGIEDRTTMAPLGPVPRLRGVRPVELIRTVALT